MSVHINQIVEKANPPAVNKTANMKRKSHATIVEFAIKVKVNNS
jgi:hypothetical protein